MARLYYFHDPMCAWCWAYRPVARDLFAQLPVGVDVEKVLGGLAPDTDEPMPADMRAFLVNTWQKIHAEFGTEFNFDFWRDSAPRRSTYPACRAVIAAAKQGRGDEMHEAIQKAYYLRALNPSDGEVLCELAADIRIDEYRFAIDLESTETHVALHEQIAFTRQVGVRGFPSLALGIGDTLAPLRIDYRDAGTTLRQIRDRLNRQEPSR